MKNIKYLWIGIFILIGFPVNLSAKANSTVILINVEPGTLPSLLEDATESITDLTISGVIHETDLQFIRKLPNIENLDISNITFVRGYFNEQPIYNMGYTNAHDIRIYSMNKLKTIKLPHSVVYFSERAVVGMELTSITIGKNVEYIETGGVAAAGMGPAFGGVKLTELIVPDDNLNFSSIDGVIFSKDKSVLVLYPYGREGEYIVPDGVTLIGKSAFLESPGLTSITISSTVDSIAIYAFLSCHKLTDIVIQEGLRAISDFAFLDCALTSLDIPNSVKLIDMVAFSYCKSLTTVRLGSGIEFIGNATFDQCTALTEIYSLNPIPPSVYEYNNPNLIPIFSESFAKNCTLYVPKGSYTAYSTDVQWKDFKMIIEIDDTKIEQIENSFISYINTPGGICIQSEKIVPVSIYTMSGERIRELTVHGSINIKLNSGVYILKAGNSSQKINVY